MTLGCSVKEAGRPPASSFLWSVSQEDDDHDHEDHGGDDHDELDDILDNKNYEPEKKLSILDKFLLKGGTVERR